MLLIALRAGDGHLSVMSVVISTNPFGHRPSPNFGGCVTLVRTTNLFLNALSVFYSCNLQCYTQDCKRVMHCNCLTVPKPPPPPNMRVGVFEIHLTTLTDVEAQQDSNQQQSLSAAESRLATYCIVCQRNLRLSQIIRVQ